jgi:ABC-type transporter Mla MlaB component
MKNQALQYYMHYGPTAFRFELAGDLNHEGAHRLDQDWRRASSAIGDRRLVVDMTFVTDVDGDGLALIIRWHRAGARFVANSKASRTLVESVLGETPLNPASASSSDADQTWLPFHTS